MFSIKNKKNDGSQPDLGLDNGKTPELVQEISEGMQVPDKPSVAEPVSATLPPGDNMKVPEKKFPPSTAVSIGAFLLDARTRADLSLNQVSSITKIHIQYLEAIEREDFKSTPPFIYVKAYIKKICILYGADTDYAIQLLSPHFKIIENNVPDKVIKALEENKQVDARQEEKVRLWVKAVLISALSVVVLIASICFFSIKSKSKSDVADKPLTSSEKQQLIQDMEKFITPQSVAFREIKTPSKSGK